MNIQGMELRNAGAIRHLTLPALSPELNVILGGNGTGKSTLRKFIRHVLAGGAPPVATAEGALNVVQAGRVLRAQRIGGELRLSSVDAGGPETTTWLNPVAPELYQSLFEFDTNRLDQAAGRIAQTLTQNLNVPVGALAWGNEDEYRARRETIQHQEVRLASLRSQANDLESRRQETLERLQHGRSVLRRRDDLDREIAELESRLKHTDRITLERRIEHLDAELAELRARLEKAEWESRQTITTEQPNYAIGLYDHLDTIDRHLSRLQGLLDLVQDRRLKMKAEIEQWKQLSLESESHPYHEIREIVNSLSEHLNTVHAAVQRLATHRDVPESVRSGLRNDTIGYVDQAHEDLARLCRELGERFVQFRHRSAADELRELRGYHDRLRDDIQSAVDRRRWLLEQLEEYDPLGSDAFKNRHHEWSSLAIEKGHAFARQQLVGPLPRASVTQLRTMNTDLPLLRRRVSELESQRAELVARLVELENAMAPLQQQLQSLKAERAQWVAVELQPLERDLASIETNLRGVRDEIRELEARLASQQQISLVPPNPILLAASELARRLTCGEVTRVGFERTATQSVTPVATVRFGDQVAYDSLGSSTQQQVLLSLVLAGVLSLASRGQRAPLLLDDVWVNLDPKRIRATCDVLCDVARQGVQIIALTAEMSVGETLRDRNVVVMDLPETGVTDAPWTSPERRSDWSLPPRSEVVPPATVTVRSDLSWNHPTWGVFGPPTSTDLRSTAYDSRKPTSHRSDAAVTGVATEMSERAQFLEPSAAACTEETRLDDLGYIPPAAIEWLRQRGCRSVGDLLDLDPSSLSEEWSRGPASGTELNRWQALAWLMICVPGLSAEDAEMMFEAGITEPEQLDGLTAAGLVERLRRYHGDMSGRGYDRLDRNRAERWINGVTRTRSRWYSQGGYSRRRRSRRSGDSRTWQRHDRPHERRGPNYRSSRDSSERTRRDRDSRPSERSEELRPRIARLDHGESQRTGRERDRVVSEDRVQQRPVGEKTTAAVDDRVDELKFYLNLDDPIEAAPSIGAKTAARFEKIGIKTVRQFLQHTAESMAEKINYKRINAETIQQWQQQARLVCRVPNLRGHDAQILVACGIVEAEDLAGKNPSELYKIVAPFSETKEGLRIIRSGKKPDLDEVTDWVNWAAQTRSLQAA